MKILIGTPIHISKDYSMARWLENVAKLREVYPADFLMVDNSDDPSYVKKVDSYCAKYKMTNYKLNHIVVDPKLHSDRKVEVSQEFIRQHVLDNSYDAWFSWECDQIIPTDALDKLIKLAKAGNYIMIAHNSWARGHPTFSNFDMGCTLIKRECLEKYGFTPNEFYKISVSKGGGNYIEVDGLISPIYHLDDKVI